MQWLILTAVGSSALAGACVALRLLQRHRRLGAKPVAVLALALLSGSTLTQLVVASWILCQGSALAGPWLRAALYLSIGLSVACIVRFNHLVYHPRSVALHAVTGAVAAYFVLLALWRALRWPDGPLFELDVFYGLLFLVFLWSAAEALACWASYRRTPGLDPLVVDRFRLWAMALFAALGWIGADSVGRGSAASRSVGALCAVLAAAAIWLAFAPPAWYRRRRARAAA